MKNVFKKTAVSVGLAVLAVSAWAQFAPNMDAAAVQAQVKQQLAANVSVDSIVQAALQAGLSPESVIESVLAATPSEQVPQVAEALQQALKDNPDALKALAAALSGTGFQLAGLNAGAAGAAGAAPTAGLQVPVNSLFGANGPAAGSGGARAASPN